MPPQIPVFKPLIESEELEASRHSLELGWLGMGSFVGEFERALAQFLELDGDRRVVAVSTGHAAIHLSLLLLGVGPGDEVITPSFNNITDFQAILATGATPVLCDVRDEDLCIDLDKAADVLSARTKAIIATDYGCMLCDHGRLARFAGDHGIRVVHDAAHSFGSRSDGRMVGSFSDIAVFSFDPVKTVTCIDGGAVVVRGEETAAILHELRLVGMRQSSDVMYEDQRAWTYDVRRLGFRYHMANLHAAIGMAQLAKMARITETRRTACRTLAARLGGIPELRVPATNYDDITPFLFYVRVPAARRSAFRGHLRDRGVDTGIHWQPGHAFSVLRDAPRGALEVTDRAAGEIVSLPLHSAMADDDLDRIAAAVTSYFEEAT